MPIAAPFNSTQTTATTDANVEEVVDLGPGSPNTHPAKQTLGTWLVNFSRTNSLTNYGLPLPYLSTAGASAIRTPYMTNAVSCAKAKPSIPTMSEKNPNLLFPSDHEQVSLYDRKPARG
ncbi:hypothetical protein BO86DRAFT_379359 [Aspergillus japonicus CBS 114.51]|uniref:Uncharacterized protein n=1 Tax=Aspergillus japonicus CBS 114.51 TaxID=1448312 RepID=A0A8T8X1P6_ASPJA|nr:hypothetical protein BO86DRAFT_379359 [Aspergillus japonicus CBS 114.51]RAH81830.1 hypothetical protein BO86DRAFT_379359 [Aspergillus japonicus CBS 114.51]